MGIRKWQYYLKKEKERLVVKILGDENFG